MGSAPPWEVPRLHPDPLAVRLLVQFPPVALSPHGVHLLQLAELLGFWLVVLP